MDRINILSCFGSRPEAIKMAPLIKELQKDDRFDPLVCVTAQHREMLDQVLGVFDIEPEYDLDIMKNRQSLTHITSSVLKGMDKVLNETKPDILLVHGDTATTFAASLAAFYKHIAVGHVEAGLRTYKKYSPFPEEVNRKLTAAVADIHFAPTQSNKDNLLKENISPGSIYVTGNTAIDVLKTTVREDYVFRCGLLNEIDFKTKKIIAMTAHRRENLGKPLENIVRAVSRITGDHDDIEVVYPVHMNPEVRETVFRVLGSNRKVHLIDPIDVIDMHNLMARSHIVMTDSGGLQEEAPSLGKPVLVLRRDTERQEAVIAGTVKLTGVEEEDIYRDAKELLENKRAYDEMANRVNPYGDGHASGRIRDALLYFYGIINTKPADWKACDA